MRNLFLFCAVLLCFFVHVTLSVAQQLESVSVRAQDDLQLINYKKRLLAKSFVSRIKSGFARADDYLSSAKNDYLSSAKIAVEKNILPDGEILLLQPIFKDGNIRVDGVIYGVMSNKKVLLSLRDFGEVLQIPIAVDGDNKTAKGWYIREDKTFNLDMNDNIVRTDIGTFTPSDEIIIENGDILVPVHELGKWLDFQFTSSVAMQELSIKSSVRLPIQERLLRRKERNKHKEIPEPSLPLGGEDYQVASVPTVDVFTRSSYRKSGVSDKGGVSNHNATIRTVGDLAYGTLTTQSQLNERDNLSSVRVNYKQESNDPELLGSLKARSFELGDVITTRIPLGGSVAQELGVRVTNTDKLRTFSKPTTGISGTAFPGWDVELYRNNQFVGFKEIGEDGFYSFDNVNLFLQNNDFKLIFYGPQGEVREEEVFVPVNNSLSRGQAVYDVSLSLDGENTHNDTNGFEGEDDGALNISALYEKPVVAGVTASAGIRSSEHEGVRNTVGNLGVSMTVLQTLVNAGLASDDEGELAADLTMRRDFAENEVRYALDWRGSYFDMQGGDSDIGTLSNNLNITGPIPLGIGKRPRYNMNVSYLTDTNDDYTLGAVAGINTAINHFSLNEQLSYSKGNRLINNELLSSSNISGTYGLHRLRLSAEYALQPKGELRNVLARYNKKFSDKFDIEFGVTNRHQISLTEYLAKLDWQAGFIRLTPTVTYNSNRDLFAGLSTRFGILQDPSDGRVKMFDRSVADSGGASAFVFLDKDGNGEFNGDDEPLEGVVVVAPQNGGRETTDEHGISLFTRMTELRLTDIYIDKDSLQDPTWVSGFEGISLVPREGYIAEIKFPVHYAGEIDGSVFAHAVSLPWDLEEEEISIAEPKPVSLRGVTLKLYNQEGEVEQSVTTDSTGFYYFTLVPPGRYLLIIDEKSAQAGRFIRPEPQQIEIGYDGTVIYGNDLFVDTGGEDIPSVFLPDLEDYKARHPHVDFTDQSYDLVLNLGEYNSRLLMSVVWYKLKSRYNNLIGDGDLFVPPAQSFADIKTGKHTLRVGLRNKEIDQAYSICRSLMAREQQCKVEIFPSYIKQAYADLSVKSN